MAKAKNTWSKDFYEYVKKQVTEVVIENVVSYVYATMQRMVEEVVYNAYSPTRYVRRGINDGLADVSNFEFKITDFNTNGFTIFIWNNTPISPIGDNIGEDLDEIIVEGDRYTWENSKIYALQPYPRDFYDATMYELIKNGTLYSSLKSKLQARGIFIV